MFYETLKKTLLGIVLILLPTQMVCAGDDTKEKDKITLSVTNAYGSLRLNGEITIIVKNLYQWVDKNGLESATKMVLYLNGHPMKGRAPFVDQVANDKLSYKLVRTEDNAKDWDELLGRPSAFTKNLRVAVGFEGQEPIEFKPGIDFVVIDQCWFWFYLSLLLIVIVLFVWLARESDILRDVGPDPTGKRKAFSLGRSQMAAWFFLVLASYVFIWMVTGSMDTLTGSVLALIGISAATGMTGAVIDLGKRSSAANEKATLELEKATLEEEKRQVQPAGQQLEPEKESKLKELPKKIEALTKALSPLSSDGGTLGFFKDILTDANGISFHRFQIAAWTIVLGVIFVASVYRGLSMPKFPDALLGLMGISSGTYIGFKFPESQRVD